MNDGYSWPGAGRWGPRDQESVGHGVSLRELRERCQLPVREHNDIAGLLFGDFASLPLTKLFVDCGWSPTSRRWACSSAA